MSSPKGEHQGVSYEIFDLTGMRQAGFVPAFYYTVGEDVEAVEEPGLQTISLEGPYATEELAIKAAKEFIECANTPS